MPELRAVLLDAGGTLVHPDHEFILARLAGEGVQADAAAYAAARRHATAAVGDILRSADPGTDASRARAYFGALLSRLGLPPDRLEPVGADIRARHEEGRLWIRTAPGTRELLLALRDAGLRLAVISNADGRVAEYLETAGLGDLFEFVLDSTLVEIEKPDPRIFRMACRRLDLTPAECVYVGDTYEVDVLGARGVGMPAVLLTDEPIQGVACIPDLAALPRALDLVLQPAGDVASSRPRDGA